MRWLWLAGALLLAIAAAATWFAFHDPRFVAGLSAIAAAALWKAVTPMLKPKDFTPEQLEKIRQGKDPFRKGHDEGGHR